MDETLTQKQREAVEALDGARRAGISLSDYAKAKGLELSRPSEIERSDLQSNPNPHVLIHRASKQHRISHKF
jgi:hypothetical protein